MAFWGSEFIFDGISCREFGMMVYSFDSNRQDDVDFQAGEIIEDRLPGRYDSLTYGLVQNQALEYTLVFGASVDSPKSKEGIDRYDIEAISSWLTGHNKRKKLMILQEDMEPFWYKCFISELKLITYGNIPWAFSCKVSCDSPFAYTLPMKKTFSIKGSEVVRMFNRSSYNGYYMPKMEISVFGEGGITIENLSDNGRVFQFHDLPNTSSIVISIDNQNQVITNNMDLNLYPYFNMKFMRLVRGDNKLKITGDANITFICEFPVNIGG